MQKRLKNMSTSNTRKKKSYRDDDYDSDDESEQEYADTSRSKRTFARCFTEKLNKLASAPPDQRHAVSSASAVRSIGFLPAIPAVKGMDRSEFAGIASQF